MENGRSKNFRLADILSGREENSDDTGVDRISKLPESIISVILSFLPTKTAVTTSVLSKRWRFLWTTSFNLDFSHSDRDYGDGDSAEEKRDRNMEFVQYVNRVLLHQKAGYINNFSLKWLSDFVIPSFVNDWVTAAMIRHVQELHVVVRTDTDTDAPPIPMPIGNIFTSERLVSLELSYCNISISAAMPICLPRLERLTLLFVQFQNPEAFEGLITGCPIMEYVEITLEATGTPFKYMVSSDSLTELKFCLIEPIEVIKHAQYSIELEAPSLEFLDLDGSLYWISIRGRLTSLVEAWLNIEEYIEYWDWEADYYNSMVLVVRALSSAKYLFLASHVVWAMSYATIRLCTKFDRLEELAVGALRYYGSSIVDLIQCSENIQVLKLWMECTTDLDDVDPDDLPPNLPSWRNPEDIPICFSNTLKTVKIYKYNGCDEEYAMIEYILQSGSLIDVMEITVLEYVDQKLTLVRDICGLPRKSPTCKVEFELREY